MPLRVEKLLVRKTILIQEQEEKEAISEFQNMGHTLLKEQMNELNVEVTGINNQINRLILHTASVNDSINGLMTRAVNEPHLLDTIQELYNSGILTDELKIDSLNLIFKEKSNRLLKQIRVFNQEDRDLKIIQSGVKGKARQLRYFSFWFLFHVGVMVVAFISGFLLLLAGLKNWKKYNRSIRDSSIES